MKLKWRAFKAFGNYSVRKKFASNMALTHVNDQGKIINYSGKRSAQMAAYYKNIEEKQ